MACADCQHRGLLLRSLAARIDRLVDRGAGSRARDLLRLDDAALVEAAGGSRQASRLDHSAIADLEDELDSNDCWAACPHDPDWPSALLCLGPAAPRALFGRGDRARLALLSGSPAVTIIGARRAGPYGLEVAGSLAERMAAIGVSVVSGMALGADTAAHEGALLTGVTVAVLGSGPERAYPRSRSRLYREIVTHGLVLSELPPGTPTFRWTFPARNRIMAALSEATIVVEAAERSGSLITAEMAADCGRHVAAVPGPINSWRSSGTNRLLADGAALVRGPEDVLDLVFGPGSAPPAPSGPALGPDEARILDAVEAGASSADEIATRAGSEPTAALAAISRLELAGYVEVRVGGQVRRTARPPPGRSAA